MIAPLLEFIATLRRHRLGVSTAESMDAMRAAATVGWGDSELLRAALAACLVKNGTLRAEFDRCFDAFFRAREAPVEGDHDLLADLQRAGHDLSPARRVLASGGAGEREMALLRAAREAGTEQLRLFTQRGLYLRRLLDALGVEELEQVARDTDAQGLTDLGQALHARARAWRNAAAAHIDGQLALRDRAERRELTEQRLLETSLGRLEPRERRQLNALVAQLAQALASRPRPRPEGRRGRLDVPRTLRRNARYDGVPLIPQWRQRRPRQAILYVLCDVSGSVAAYAGLLLQLLGHMQNSLPRVRSFVFCSGLTEVSNELRGGTAEQRVSQVLQRYGGGASDYGHALGDFCHQHLHDLNRHASVLLLGDARNNLADPHAERLGAVAARAGRVLWFNPEPANLWNTGDSVLDSYARHCRSVHPCNTLAQLAAAARELLRQV